LANLAGLALGICLASTCLPLAGCRTAAFALLPRAPMGPQRDADPFAPLVPPVAARTPEGQAPTMATPAGDVDVGLSAAALAASFLSAGGLFFGMYGTFEETKLVAPERAPGRPRPRGAAAPSTTTPAVPTTTPTEVAPSPSR
jgi:hypothetical protein